MAKAEQQSVALTQIETDIVNSFSRRTGVNNFSAALRFIIRAWEQQNKSRGTETWIPEDLTLETVEKGER